MQTQPESPRNAEAKRKHDGGSPQQPLKKKRQGKAIVAAKAVPLVESMQTQPGSPLNAEAKRKHDGGSPQQPPKKKRQGKAIVAAKAVPLVESMQTQPESPLNAEAKRKHDGGSPQQPLKKKRQGKAIVAAPAVPLDESWVPQLRLNQALTHKMGFKYCTSGRLPELLIEAGCCSRQASDSKVELDAYLRGQLRRQNPVKVSQLVQLMVFRGLCKEVHTFKVSVRRMDGKEVDVTLDEEHQRVGDLRRELERLEGIPRHAQELYWFVENGEDKEESVVGEDVTFYNACTLALCINKDKPCRPNFVAVLFTVFKRTLHKRKYQELRQLIDTLKQRQSSGSSSDKARELCHQIMSVVGRTTMKQAMADAKAELKLRSTRLSKYESLLLHLLDGGSPEGVPPSDQLACRNLKELLDYYRRHKRAGGGGGGGDDKDAHDERLKAMRTILEGATDLRVRELLVL
jgi:hypothetical protein